MAGDATNTGEHVPMHELEAALEAIRAAPRDGGTLESIVRRPREGVREALEDAELELHEGLRGDNWLTRGSSSTPDGACHPDKQLTVMNARVAAAIAGERERWALAGDQLYVDLDLSQDNLPAGTRLAIGNAVIEVTAPPHNGCKKFTQRFGKDAIRFVNSDAGKQLRLRGLNARVVDGGTVRIGDRATKL